MGRRALYLVALCLVGFAVQVSAREEGDIARSIGGQFSLFVYAPVAILLDLRAAGVCVLPIRRRTEPVRIENGRRRIVWEPGANVLGGSGVDGDDPWTIVPIINAGYRRWTRKGNGYWRFIFEVHGGLGVSYD